MFTRCPHCRTTFRITADALDMAAGQVRCGRCMQVFDANADLADHLADLESEPPVEGRPAAAPAGASDGSSARAAEPADGGAAADGASGTQAGAGRSDGLVLLSEDWRVDAPGRPPRRRGAWAAAAALAALALAVQLAHQFRSRLVEQPYVGEPVAGAYEALGIEVVPRRDPNQYRIRDWVATAEQTEGGRSSLLIRAEIANRGPGRMPQPHLYLALMDRWDDVVASRVFAPEEYLDKNRADAMMNAGASTVAELEVVDPGPEASGFEIDVCVPRPGGVRCAGDAVFR